MLSGRPGDPLFDILVRGVEKFGKETDDAIRGVSELSSRRELYEWWSAEIKPTDDSAAILKKAEKRFMELMQRSNMSGWGGK